MATVRKLNDTQLIILADAARHPRGVTLPLPKGMDRSSDTIKKALEQLLKRALVAEVAAEPEDQEWRGAENGRRLTLAITQAGLAVIGLGELGADADQSTDDTDKKTSKRNPAGSDSGAAEARTVRESRQRRKNETPPPPNKRATSELHAGDDTTNGAPSKHVVAIPPDAKAVTFAPGTKAAAVVKLLRRKNGASLVELTQTSGWQAHSVRGFLSGTLKMKLRCHRLVHIIYSGACSA